MAQTQLISQPPIVLNEFTGSTERKCKIIAAESQVAYEYLRRDVTISGLAEGTGGDAGFVKVDTGIAQTGPPND